ncbi:MULTISPECIES: heavy metal translocating P-type ATPase [Glutamicibacter]|uniref:Heavy metal-translocating P-type ATPase Cd/Co/Hg/Pb/Zn-transporting n=1 Tax=Glutamicibacter nicotianae TaxID=37929 RepID=A0ABQ0RMS8_GLUNI|nr:MULTISPECIES: cation-translocating P-type ATPase [Glutamicibacter]UTM48228.1 cation-translocating P-type ATPase [Glutamicibacter mysorens]GEC13111.1 heavy metal-translocating P-type ATPase Cd/Co/Hg/Pb/Zn-transporting [Glutamicibacter nicotianae]
MSSACGCESPETTDEIKEELPWYRDWHVLIPITSGISFLAGLILEWTTSSDTAEVVALVFFWIGLLLGAYTFVPGALRNLFSKRKIGIGLLMTISAVGAVILGYVEEAAALAFLYSIAEALEDKAMDRARSGLRSLLKLVPETATVIRSGMPTVVSASKIRIGDLLRVKPGERLATDGVISQGSSSLDTSAITGESIPVDVSVGDQVAAGSINTSGSIEVTASANGTDNSLTTLVSLVEQAQAERGERARLADRIARPLVPGVIVLAVLVATIGSLFGDPETWITRALVVLVAASPCAMAIAVPVTVVSAIGAASKFGVIIKSGAAFERLGSLRRIAVDKTGTLTRNQPAVTQVHAVDGVSQDAVLNVAAALEQHSTHPLARAISSAVSSTPEATEVAEEPGHGITGVLNGEPVAVGSPRWITPGTLTPAVESMEASGQTCVMVTRAGQVIGVIGVRDELRPEAPEAVRHLRDQGIDVLMLTGDNARTAHALAAIAGIDTVHAELRPEDKAREVAASVQQVPTGMIGDGINDAPALATATVGIAMGATGADAAIESADVAFTGHDLRLIPQALSHARRGRTIMNQNIILSLAIIIVLLPLAITGVLGLAAVVLVHEVAEVVVIANGLRAARVHRAQLSRQPDTVLA